MTRGQTRIMKLAAIALSSLVVSGCVVDSTHHDRANTTPSALSPSPAPTASPSELESPELEVSSSAPSPSARVVLSKAWTAKGLHAISKPVVAAGRVIFMTTGEDNRPVNQPFLVALDEKTGRVVWRADASDATVTLGVAPSVLVKDGVVYSYEMVRKDRVNALDAYVVAHDAASGKLLWRSSQYAQFTQYPSLCADNKALCMSAEDDWGAGSQALRIDMRTGAVGPEDDNAFPTVAHPGRNIGPDLYNPDERNPEILARYVDDQLIWSARLDSIFPPGYTTDDGWDVTLEGDTYFGSVGGPPTADRYVTDASAISTAGFDRDTGERHWLDVGSSYFCADFLHAAHVRCRFQGTVTVPPDLKVSEATFAGFSATVEGFDPLTGKTTWSWRAGDAPGLYAGSSGLFPVGDGTFVVNDTTGHHIVFDPRTGAHHAAPAGLTAWCTAENLYTYSVPYGSEGETTRLGATLLSPCSLDGAPVALPSRADALDGALDGDLFMWAQDDGVYAVNVAAAT